MSLRILLQPSRSARRAVKLEPPLILEFDFSSSLENNHHSGIVDWSRIWTFLALVDEDGKMAAHALTGTLARSAQELRSQDAAQDLMKGYFIFENLSIRKTGNYRIRATVIQMDESANGAASLQQLDSEMIIVAN
ncbi:MAG: hypothetical protein M1818_007182 [Claussenomyces sp. TS43310]|nr:MAG: hypothetical protein M1818_007182 [Claussenomyces sp. TS43310]